MDDIQQFYEALPSGHRDLFTQLLGEIGGGPGEAERLAKEFAELKAEIDRVNKRREALGARLDTVEAIHDQLRARMAGRQSLALDLLAALLEAVAAELRQEIADLRPHYRLKRKAEIAERLAAIERRRAIAAEVGAAIGPARALAPASKVGAHAGER